MSERIRRAEERFVQSMAILDELRLLERWGKAGAPCIVGAASYGLQVAPDIDLEVFCERPTVEAGFGVLAQLATHPCVTKARFANELNGPDEGLYFQLRYRHPGGEEWKLDMWLLAHAHPGPLSRDMVTPMRRALTDETREAILAIKEEILTGRLGYHSIDIYRAVLDGGARSLPEFLAWRERVRPAGLTTWKPSPRA